MHEIGATELREIAEDFGVGVRETEVEDMAQRVNELLNGVDQVYEVTDTRHKNGSESPARSWWQGNDEYNSIITRCSIPGDPNGILSGISIGLKDNISVQGVPMTCGSELMRGFVPGADAPVVERLIRAGAEITAKTNLDEFASGGPWGLSSAYRGNIANPHGIERTSGGSSGGSAAAVAAGLTDAALGTDTGGSIRMPAAFCGVVGLKPTNGIIPISGIAETSYTLDTVGPIARDVATVAEMLEPMVGPDPSDAITVRAAFDDEYDVGGYVESTKNPSEPSTIAIGVLEEGISTGINDDVEAATHEAFDLLEETGVKIVPVSIDMFDYGKDIKNVIRYFEGISYWRDAAITYRTQNQLDDAYQTAFAARSNHLKGEISNTYKSKILAGAYLMDRYDGRHYVQAQQARLTLRDAFNVALTEVDVLACPTMPATPPKFEDIDDYYARAMEENDGLNFDFAKNLRAINATGHPGISIPNSTVDDLPVGLQLIGERFGEAELLGIATTVEEVLVEV